MNLSEKIAARLDELQAIAEAATPGPWAHVDYADPTGQPLTKDGETSTFMGCGSVITLNHDMLGGDIAAPNGDLYPRGGYSPFEDMRLIAALASPDVVLQGIAEDRDVLTRHNTFLDSPESLGVRKVRWYCEGCDERFDVPYCREIRSLARRRSIEVES